jgi:hypothetical protein
MKRALHSAILFAAAFVVCFGCLSTANGGPYDGAIIVSGNTYGTDEGSLFIYSRTGQLLASKGVHKQLVGNTGDLGARPRGVTLDANGKIQLFFGTFDPRLYTYDAVAGAGQSNSATEWGLSNNERYGSIDAYGKYVYMPDMPLDYTQHGGVMRFNIDTRQTEFFQLGPQYAAGGGIQNIAVGLDGLLYAGRDGGFYVLDPITMQQIRVVSPTSSASTGIAVDADGKIYQGSGNFINVYAPDGQLLRSQAFNTNSSYGFIDVDIDPDGSLIAGNQYGQVLLTDTNFSSSTIINTSTWGVTKNFVSFYVAPVPEPSSIAMITTAGLAALAYAWRRAKRGGV